MKDPLGESVLRRALGQRDAAIADAKKLAFNLRQIQVQNADLVRMLAAVVRQALKDRNEWIHPDTVPPPIEALVLSFEAMAEEGEEPKLAYRIDRNANTLTLRLTPFPDQVSKLELAKSVEDDRRDTEPPKAPRSIIVLHPGEEGA